MASLVAFRSAIRASRASLTASRAVRRSTAAGLSATDLAWAARSSWAFFASAAALSRSAKLVFFDLYAHGENGSWLSSTGSDRRSPSHSPGAWKKPRLKARAPVETARFDGHRGV
jgi:hypothetical protein